MTKSEGCLSCRRPMTRVGSDGDQGVWQCGVCGVDRRVQESTDPWHKRLGASFPDVLTGGGGSGRIQVGGQALDNLAALSGLQRQYGESDAELRGRVTTRVLGDPTKDVDGYLGRVVFDGEES